MAKTKEEATKDLLRVLPHLRVAAEEAEAEGDVFLGILAVQQDGSGQVCSTMRAGEFFEDLATALGAPPLTDDDRAEAAAEKLVQEFGLRP